MTREAKSVGGTGLKGGVAVFGILRRGQNDPFGGPRKHPALQTRLTIAFGDG